ncbi:hypothetical protein BV22DRAFT_1128185 [Leucogyrophana mollusca]|uniref:Uncharacterized protein n=1 Tax=Leucogyrophana mollusca TaxID=85980 RepID=A0ACB8BKS4_9AGAM|nr:hypothetical protein BV22DRAFT_1128185 [Leucogyrophana mollusca]
MTTKSITGPSSELCPNPTVPACGGSDDWGSNLLSTALPPTPASVQTHVSAPLPAVATDVSCDPGTNPGPDTTLIAATYNGVTYDLPSANVAGPFYCVARGHRIGVFATWPQTSLHVTRVSRAVFQGVSSIAEGIQMIHEAIERGEAAVI